MTFVFPRGLTAPMRRRFIERLVKRHPNVEIRRWTLPRLTALINAHPEIAERHFARARQDALRAAQRSIAQGGKPSRASSTWSSARRRCRS
ncbi:MAG: hypothetical protein WKF65_08625 [Gaiellaceae bacterium]